MTCRMAIRGIGLVGGFGCGNQDDEFLDVAHGLLPRRRQGRGAPAGSHSFGVSPVIPEADVTACPLAAWWFQRLVEPLPDSVAKDLKLHVVRRQDAADREAQLGTPAVIAPR